jgi:hypothetical protein
MDELLLCFAFSPKIACSMESDIADQHRRVEDLAAALDQLLAVPADQLRIRELVSGSPPRQLNIDDASGIEALRNDTQDGMRGDGSPPSSFYRRALQGKSSVPGVGRRQGSKGVRYQSIPEGISVEHAFSSSGCVPMTIATSLPYRPSFYSAQFRAETRESMGPPVLQFENALSGAGVAAAPLDGVVTPRRAVVGAVDRREAAAALELLVRQREESRKLMELRDEMKHESARLMALAQRVRSDHAQVQKRADALTVREREVRSREHSLQSMVAQWKDEIRKVKHNHANGMRVASHVNRQLHHELSRCTNLTGADVDDRSTNSGHFDRQSS